MAEHGRVTDEEILSGFQSLHEAMARGFAGVERRFDGIERRFMGIEQRLDGVEQRLDGFATRAQLAQLEQRMMRRFDEVDERLDRLAG